ncbi:MAG: acetyl-CoA carboxylase biotin carboxyl carrier protein [Saprospiraceae bacterium]
MQFKEVQELIKLINKSNLSEFVMQDGDFKLTIRTKSYVKGKMKAAPQTQVMSMPQPTFATAPVAPTAVVEAAPKAADVPKAAPQESGEEEGNYLEVKSPIVGTFYRSPSPDKPAYIKVGDTIASGDVVCIVEAMKLFNEIESEISGKIVKVMVEDASPVQYDQVLFLVDPKG